MRNVAAGLYCETEVSGRLTAPSFDGALCGKAIEAVIDLHRVEPFEIETQHFRRRHFGGIKRSDPMLVVPSGGTDVNGSDPGFLRRHRFHWMEKIREKMAAG